MVRLRVSLVVVAFALAAFSGAASAQGSNVLQVATDATFPPMEYTDNGARTGFDIDMMNALAKAMGKTVQWTDIDFKGLIPGLIAHRFDAAISAIYITDDRAKVVDFSEPVYSYGGGLIVAARDPRQYRSVADLKGLTVGVQVGTRFFDELQGTGAKEIKTYDNLMEMLGDLSVGRIAAAYGDAPIFAYQMTQARIRGARFVQPFQPPNLEDVCLVVRKDESELLARLNASVKRLRSTVIQRILGHWGLR